MHQGIITICARAGSKGLPHKNILPFNGKPLIEWTIIQALEWSEEIPIFISSDDPVIKFEIFEEFYIANNLYFKWRPRELAQDDTPKLDVLRHILREAEEFLGRKFGSLIDLDPTNPLRTQKDLDNCLEIFEKKRPKTLISVTKAKKNPYFNQIQWSHEDFTFTHSKPFRNIINRQDCPYVYDVNSSIYFYNTDWLKEGHKTPLSDKTEIYEMPSWTRCDIDSEYDFFVAEKTMEKYL